MIEKEKVIQIYQDLLDGKKARFPHSFFGGNQGKKYLAILTRYLIEDYLGIAVEDIPRKVNAETLWNHRLRPASYVHGYRNFIDVIENAYPGKFNCWEFKKVPKHYWRGKWEETGQLKSFDI